MFLSDVAAVQMPCEQPTGAQVSAEVNQFQGGIWYSRQPKRPRFDTFKSLTLHLKGQMY